MKTITKGKRCVISLIAAILLTSTPEIYAEYYFAGDCVTPCCGSPCGRMVSHSTRVAAQRIYVPPVKKVRYYQRRPGSYHTVKVYYVWPSPCGGCGQRVVRTYCDTPRCPSFYVPPEYYTSVSNIDMYDERTADDMSW